jgi:hypothetical protein
MIATLLTKLNQSVLLFPRLEFAVSKAVRLFERVRLELHWN